MSNTYHRTFTIYHPEDAITPSKAYMVSNYHCKIGDYATEADAIKAIDEFWDWIMEQTSSPWRKTK